MIGPVDMRCHYISDDHGDAEIPPLPRARFRLNAKGQCTHYLEGDMWRENLDHKTVAHCAARFATHLSGSGQFSQPVVSPDTLLTESRLRILDLICEGPIGG